MQTDEYYMKEAINEALMGISNGNRPYASILVDTNGDIVGRGHNTVLEEHNPLAHAETNVISNYCKSNKIVDLLGYSLYATGEPCPMCAAAIGWANISRLVYGSPREDFVNPGYKRQNIHVKEYYKEQGVDTEVIGSVLRDEVKKIYNS